MMTKTVLDVHGMSCRSCVSIVTQAVALPGVSGVEVRFEQQAVAVDHDPARVGVDALVAALAAAGYHAMPRV